MPATKNLCFGEFVREAREKCSTPPPLKKRYWGQGQIFKKIKINC